MVRILHTGDVHLGRKFSGFGAFGRTLREQLRSTIRRLLRTAPGQVDLVLIAGDLFDSNEPDPSEVRQLLTAIKEIAPLPVCVLPGTHDRFNEQSVYRRSEFSSGPANLRLFNQDGPQTFLFPDLGLAVHGRANLTNRGGEPPLKEIRPHPAARFNVAIAHASVPLPHVEADDDYVVTDQSALSSGMDYIALGHWHRFGECFSASRIKVFYCGCPEPVGFQGSETAGTWARVELGDQGVDVREEASGRHRWYDVEISLDARSDDVAVRKELESRAAADAICRVRVVGRPVAPFQLRAEELEEEYADKFACLKILDDMSREVPWEELAGRFTPGTVGDLFCQLAGQRWAASEGTDRMHWNEVLRRGSALLLGEENP